MTSTLLFAAFAAALGTFAHAQLLERGHAAMMLERVIETPLASDPSMRVLLGQLAWSPVAPHIAGAVGATIYLLNADDGSMQVVPLAELGGAVLAWAPDRPLLVAELAPNAMPQSRFIDLSGGVPAVSTGYQPLVISAALRGVRFADGGETFIAVGIPNRLQQPQRARIVAYSLQTKAPLRKWPAFDDDGTAWYIGEHAARIALHAGRPIAAIYAHHVIKPVLVADPAGTQPIAEFDVWLVDLEHGSLICRLNVYDGDPRDRWGNSQAIFRGMALSRGGLLAFSSAKSLDVYDVDTCKRVHHIADGDRHGGQLEFSHDGAFLVETTSDVRAPLGGWLRVRRTRDWRLVDEESIPSPGAPAADPRAARFAISTPGRVSIYRLQ